MILVTGGTGLVGTHLIYSLLLRGDKVRALIRQNSDLTILKKIFDFYSPGKAEEMFSGIQWAEGDVTDTFSIKEALNGVEKIYHCAAVVSFTPQDMKKLHYVNAEGTANIINASLEAGIKKLIHCSSIAAIGKPENGTDLIDENLSWKASSRNPNYSISKYNAEREVWRGIEEGLNAAIVNPSIIIGPGHPYRSSGQIYNQIYKGLKFYTNGCTGYVDARDVANAMIWLMESDISRERFILNAENVYYKEFFSLYAQLIGKRPPSIKAGKLLTQLAWRLEKARSILSGKSPLITKETVRKALSISKYSNEKFIKASGFKFIPIKESIENTVNFYKIYPLPW